MTRHGLLGFVVTSLLASPLACAAEPGAADPKDPGDPSGHANQMHGVTLTSAASRQDVPVSPPAGTTTLVLTLATIHNPSSQAFSLAASLAITGGASEEAIGSITPFPATQPGSFVLTLPEPARKALARGGQLLLRLTLQPIAADRPLTEPLRVTVAAPAWR